MRERLTRAALVLSAALALLAVSASLDSARGGAPAAAAAPPATKPAGATNRPAVAKTLRAAAVQMRSSTDIVENVATIRRHLERCKAEGVRVAVFPECALTGYWSPDEMRRIT